MSTPPPRRGATPTWSPELVWIKNELLLLAMRNLLSPDQLATRNWLRQLLPTRSRFVRSCRSKLDSQTALRSCSICASVEERHLEIRFRVLQAREPDSNQPHGP